MAEGNIQLQGEGLEGEQVEEQPLVPFFHSAVSPPTSPIPFPAACWYRDLKSSVFNEPLFHFGRKHFRWLRIWFSIGIGFSLTTLIRVTLIILLESTRALNLYNGIPWLYNILNGSMFGFYSSVLKHSISISNMAYMCISSIISLSIHELGHALVVYIPVVVEKLLVNTFHVSLMLALLNTLSVYYLDGESILEVALCCFSSLTPMRRELVLRLQ